MLIAALTIATGGTATVLGALSTATVGHVVGKNVKDEVLSSALTAALTGSISGASKSTVTKNIVKSAATAAIAKKTKNSVIGSIGGSLLTGDIKNNKDLLRHVVRDITTEKLAIQIAKKHDPRVASFVAGLTGVQIDNCLKNLLNKPSLDIKKIENNKYQISTEGSEIIDKLKNSEDSIVEKLKGNEDSLLSRLENSKSNFFEKHQEETYLNKILRREENKTRFYLDDKGNMNIFDEKNTHRLHMKQKVIILNQMMKLIEKLIIFLKVEKMLNLKQVDF